MRVDKNSFITSTICKYFPAELRANSNANASRLHTEEKTINPESVKDQCKIQDIKDIGAKEELTHDQLQPLTHQTSRRAQSKLLSTKHYPVFGVWD